MKIEKKGDWIKIWATEEDTMKWANRPLNSWPCSELSGNALFVELHRGDLVDLELNSGDCVISATELNAFIEDALKAQ